MFKKHLVLVILALSLSSALTLPVDEPQPQPQQLIPAEQQPSDDPQVKEVDMGLPVYAPRESPDSQDFPAGVLDGQPTPEVIGVAPDTETADLETANTFWGIGNYGRYGGYRGYGWNPYGYHRRGYGGWGGRGWGGGWSGGWGRRGYW